VLVRFLADEDFDGRVLSAFRNLAEDYELEINVVRVQDAGLIGATDASILDWAAANRRVVLTHDRRTMPSFAWQRMASGLPMSGVVVTRRGRSPGETGHAIVDEVSLRARENRGWDDEVVLL